MGTRLERKERITEQRKQQILDAALTIFSRKGFGEATVPDIAHEAGIAVGTIYNYYQSKRDLLVSLLANYVFTQPFVMLLEQSLETDDITFLRSVIENRLDFGFENMDRFFFLLSEVQRDPELRRQYAHVVMWPVLVLLEKYLDTRVSSGTFRPLDVNVISRALGGMMIGFLLLCRIEGDEGPCLTTSRRELAAMMADLVLNGLQTGKR
ncbi:MAG: TetR/AcrR family transcriptional regulator [Dehalococcoidia bacterium]|nr:MAG: TetR/AcrR family transcriptional regulator [Dehalococcoidia bacterium]